MDAKTKATFISLMKMTTSSHDNEALTAMRMANKILVEHHVDWEEFLDGVTSRSKPIRRQQQPREKPHTVNAEAANFFHDFAGRHNNAEEINPLFMAAFDKVHNYSFRRVLLSAQDTWLRRGYLTQREYATVKRAATGVA